MPYHLEVVSKYFLYIWLTMTLRLPATPLNLSDIGSDDERDTRSSSDQAEETWSDWVSDSANQPCQSLFDDRYFSSPEEALSYDKKTHGYDLAAECARLCESETMCLLRRYVAPNLI